MNGFGPAWFPAKWRSKLTRFSERFFDRVAADKHDAGYKHGFPSRSECDAGFLAAMLRSTHNQKVAYKIWGRVWLAGLFWLAVRAFGWLSYNYKG